VVDVTGQVRVIVALNASAIPHEVATATGSLSGSSVQLLPLGPALTLESATLDEVGRRCETRCH